MINDLLLVTTVAGRSAAIRAAEVESVIEIDAFVPIPLAPSPVIGLATLRSRVLTVIDVRAALNLEPDSAAPQGRRAIVIDCEGHSYALLVDAVLDVTPALSELEPTRADTGDGWAAAGRGMVETVTGPLLVLDGATLARGVAFAEAA